MGREAAAAILALAEGGLMMGVGPHAALLPEERGKIEPPLGRVLARMTPAGAELVATFADPIMLGIGILAYLTRVMAHQKPATPRQGAQAPRTAPQGPPVPIRPSVAATGPSAATVNGQTPAASGFAGPDAGLFAES